jgi:hypothetical protein
MKPGYFFFFAGFFFAAAFLVAIVSILLFRSLYSFATNSFRCWLSYVYEDKKTLSRKKCFLCHISTLGHPSDESDRGGNSARQQSATAGIRHEGEPARRIIPDT